MYVFQSKNETLNFAWDQPVFGFRVQRTNIPPFSRVT